MSAGFELRNAGMRYGAVQVLRGVTLKFDVDRLTVLVGPNGAGKSTLVGIMAGLRERYLGECLFDGIEVRKWDRRQLAKRVSFVPQMVRIEFPFTAGQVVMMGRAPHASGFFESELDLRAAEEAMELTDTLPFRDRDVRSLSEGERRRVILAAALAQSPQALLLDEPATSLDVRHQLDLHRVLRTLQQRGVLVVAITHDLNMAAAYADRVVALCDGEVVADGGPEEALRPDLLRRVFQVSAEVMRTNSGRPWIAYGE